MRADALYTSIYVIYVYVYTPTNSLFVCVNRRTIFTRLQRSGSYFVYDTRHGSQLMTSQRLRGHAHNATLSLAATNIVLMNNNI